MRESFVFYKSFYNAIEMLPQKERLKNYQAIICHGLELAESPDVSGVVTELVYPLIDRSNARYDAQKRNGKLGGRPKTVGENQNPNETQP